MERWIIEALGSLASYQLRISILDAIFGTWITFGALKWRKGLIAYTAILWGLVLGGFIGLMFCDLLCSSDVISWCFFRRADSARFNILRCTS